LNYATMTTNYFKKNQVIRMEDTLFVHSHITIIKAIRPGGHFYGLREFFQFFEETK